METAIGIVRKWIQWNAENGSTVTWGSNDVLRFNKDLKVKDLENLALEIEQKIKSHNSGYVKCSECGSDEDTPENYRCEYCKDQHFA